MRIDPPNGSNIAVTSEEGYTKIAIPNKSWGVIRFVVSLFLIFWLGGWAMGWWSAASALLGGNNSVDFFLLFWLGGWSVGGIFAVWFLYRLLRPSIPETLLLKNRSVEYDSGVPGFQLTFGFVTPSDYWKQFFPKRQQIEIRAGELSSLAVREHSTGNRLTLDYGNERLEIASGSTEIEREWLYKELERKYS